MKILITGGSGTLGSALTQKIIKKQYRSCSFNERKELKNDVKNYLWDWSKNEIEKTV